MNKLFGNEVINNTCNGKCSSCGDCCGPFIPFTKPELRKIKEYVKEHNIPFKNRNVSKNEFDGSCCFLDFKTRKCVIYEVRPYTCRNFLCSHKDWKQRRLKYDLRADYNCTKPKIKLISFDELIYNDYELIVRYVCDLAKDETGGVNYNTFLKVLDCIGRRDLLDHMKIETSE